MQSDSQSSGQPDRLLRDTEMAALLGVSRRFVHTLRSRGVLRAVRLGNCLRFSRAETLARVLGTGDDGKKGGRAV
jgi:excisionase family DNA binding protein